MCRSKPSAVMSRYSTSAQYFGAAQWSILFFLSGFFASGIFCSVIGFSNRDKLQDHRVGEAGPGLADVQQVLAFALCRDTAMSRRSCSQSLRSGRSGCTSSLIHDSVRSDLYGACAPSTRYPQAPCSHDLLEHALLRLPRNAR